MTNFRPIPNRLLISLSPVRLHLTTSGLLLLLALLPLNLIQSQSMPKIGSSLSPDQVNAFTELALKNIDIEYPNKPSNVMAGPESVRSPKAMHPAFYGSFDWHSSVHGHWMLIRLLKLYPKQQTAAQIRKALDAHLSKEALQAETDYFAAKHNKSFERMYGWAWFFRLVLELEDWNDSQGRNWRQNLRPLEALLTQRMMDYLPLLTFPIRTGVHPDTGFALSLTLDYARATGNSDLENLIVKRTKDYYLDDVRYPFAYEPSGQDFFSSGLNEADLMWRVLSPGDYSDWLARFLPDNIDDLDNLLSPVAVSDVTDGKIVHLAGLDLSRAWCLQGIAEALKEDDPWVQSLKNLAQSHADMGFGYIFSGHYEGEHWLATFAVYTLTEAWKTER